MTRILVVDDEADLELLIKQKFRKQIANQEFEFFFTHNGIEALVALDKDPDISMMISDINMPEMDGLTLIDRVGEYYPHIICVIMSAYGDISNMRAAMKLGAFDFVTKPINFGDLNVTINQALKHVTTLRDAEMNKLKLHSVLQELNVAATMQQAMLPKKFIDSPTTELYATLLPAKETGGDSYDFFYLNDHKVAFVIASISGRGISASLFMTIFRTLLRARAQIEILPGDCLRKVNELLLKENDHRMSIAAFYGQIDLNTGHIDYASAGQLPPILLKKSGETKKLSTVHAASPLGIKDGHIYISEYIDLTLGDTLFLYTKGLPEAINAEGQKFGIETVIESLKSTSDKPTKEIIETLQNKLSCFAKSQELAEDATFLCVKIINKSN